MVAKIPTVTVIGSHTMRDNKIRPLSAERRQQELREASPCPFHLFLTNTEAAKLRSQTLAERKPPVTSAEGNAKDFRRRTIKSATTRRPDWSELRLMDPTSNAASAECLRLLSSHMKARIESKSYFNVFH